MYLILQVVDQVAVMEVKVDSEGRTGSESFLVAVLALRDAAEVPGAQGPPPDVVQRVTGALVRGSAAPSRRRPPPPEGQRRIVELVDFEERLESAAPTADRRPELEA